MDGRKFIVAAFPRPRPQAASPASSSDHAACPRHVGTACNSEERPEGLRLYGSAFIAHLAVDTDRHYQNGAGIDGSSSDTDGVGYGMAVRGGWEVPVRSALAVMPYAELQGTEVDLNDYAEKGGAFPAQFSDQTARLLTSRLGAEVTYQAKPTLKVQPRLAWGHELSGNGGSLTATTVGLTQVLNPRQSDSDWAEGAVAAVWRVTDATTLSAELAGRAGHTAEPDVGVTVGISTRL